MKPILIQDQAGASLATRAPPTSGKLHTPPQPATTVCAWSPLSLALFLSLSPSLSPFTQKLHTKSDRQSLPRPLQLPALAHHVKSNHLRHTKMRIPKRIPWHTQPIPYHGTQLRQAVCHKLCLQSPGHEASVATSLSECSIFRVQDSEFQASGVGVRCRVNMAHVRKSRPDPGRVPSALGSGWLPARQQRPGGG